MTQIGKISADKNQEEYLHKDITSKIIEAFYTVYNSLGFGFLEKVYENALTIELKNSNYKVENQKPVNVYYNKLLVGEYYADLIVEDKVIVELKAIDTLVEIHENQLINYLKATDKEVGLLLNFGKKPEIKRKVFSNKFKNQR